MLFAAPLAAGFLIASCSGNPTCVFVGGCQGGAGGPGGGVGTPGRAALRPEDGLWISNALPDVTAVFPQGAQVHPDSPIVIVFNESMNEATLEEAFEVVSLTGGIFESPIDIQSQVLVGAGRVLLLFPQGPMDEGSYSIRVASEQGGPFGGGDEVELPTDLTGQELVRAAGAKLGSDFVVPAVAPAAPRLLTTFPAAGETAASHTTELLAVFDRPMDASTVTDASFVVLENGAAPALDPVAKPLEIGPETETRVFRWQSVDMLDVPAPLATDAEIELTLSPAGSSIRDADGGTLPRTDVAFDVAPFSAPVSSGICSQPEDAIGIRNLVPDGNEDLEIQVDLLDAQDGDLLELFLFGTSTDAQNPQLVAQRRQLSLSGAAPILVALYELEDIDLTVNGDPDEARFADGSVAFAFHLRRGALVSPLRMLDVDPVAEGIQDPVLDTTAPRILSLEFSDGTTGFTAWDVSDLVLAGKADGVLRSVEVHAMDGPSSYSTANLAPVLGTRADGAFLSALFGTGVLDSGSATFTAVGYDHAFNASPAITGTFDQVGAVGPVAFVPGDDLLVHVFDAETLRPLSGARVAVHDDLGDGINYPPGDSGTTAVDGTFPATTNALAVGAIVTVDAAGYDLVSFHGVTATSISIPLRRTNAPTGSVSGAVLATDSLVQLVLPGLDRRMDDTRRPRGVARGYATGACTLAPVFRCPYGPEQILAGRLGAQSFLAGDFQATELSFNADLVLQGFCLDVPLRAIGMGAMDDSSFTLPFLLNDAGVVPEEKPEELDPLVLRGDLALGIDTAALDDDPTTTGAPRISVEANVIGIPGAVQVGMGLAFDQGGDRWNVRSARPGAVTAAGFFGMGGTVDTDLFVRCELRDLDGDVSGVRPRLSDLPGLVGGEVTAPAVPDLTSPLPGGITGGRAYDLVFQDTLPDSLGFEGLYRAQLTDSAGRRWVLWRVDPAGAGEVRIHVSDIATPLADGAVTCELSAYAWKSLDTTSFLWTDVEREQNVFAIARSVGFTQTP